MSIPVRTVAALLMVWTAVACRAPERAPSPIPADARVERLATGMEFTEGPVWLADRQVLVFSDTRAGRLMQWREGGGLSVYREEADPNGNALDPRGRLLTCRHRARDVVREEDDGSLTVVCDRFDGRRFNSPNDLAVQRDGTVWFTDPPWGLPRQREGRELPGHWVFRVDPGGAVEAVLTDRAMPNGIALSADERTLYVADTGGHPSHPDPSFRDRPVSRLGYRDPPPARPKGPTL